MGGKRRKVAKGSEIHYRSEVFELLFLPQVAIIRPCIRENRISKFVEYQARMYLN